MSLTGLSMQCVEWSWSHGRSSVSLLQEIITLVLYFNKALLHEIVSNRYSREDFDILIKIHRKTRSLYPSWGFD